MIKNEGFKLIFTIAILFYGKLYTYIFAKLNIAILYSRISFIVEATKIFHGFPIIELKKKKKKKIAETDSIDTAGAKST